MSELIKDQILHPQPLLQESSYMRLLFHQQFFSPPAWHYDISARTETSSLNCHQSCLGWIKTPQLPPCDVSQKCHFYLQQVMPQLTVSMSFQGEGAEGGKRGNDGSSHWHDCSRAEFAFWCQIFLCWLCETCPACGTRSCHCPASELRRAHRIWGSWTREHQLKFWPQHLFYEFLMSLMEVYLFSVSQL